MPNQPAKDSTAIYLRVPQTVKDAIQADCDKINADNPGANANISSWIRAAIDAKLQTWARAKPRTKKNT